MEQALSRRYPLVECRNFGRAGAVCILECHFFCVLGERSANMATPRHRTWRVGSRQQVGLGIIWRASAPSCLIKAYRLITSLLPKSHTN